MSHVGARLMVDVPLMQWRALMLLAHREHREPRHQLMAMIEQWWANDPERETWEQAVREFWREAEDWPADWKPS